MENDAAYFARRAGEERVAALKCTNQHARRTHLDMAKRYDELVRANGSRMKADITITSDGRR